MESFDGQDKVKLEMDLYNAWREMRDDGLVSTPENGQAAHEKMYLSIREWVLKFLDTFGDHSYENRRNYWKQFEVGELVDFIREHSYSSAEKLNGYILDQVLRNECEWLGASRFRRKGHG